MAPAKQFEAKNWKGICSFSLGNELRIKVVKELSKSLKDPCTDGGFADPEMKKPVTL
jgi:hypothetical protein